MIVVVVMVWMERRWAIRFMLRARPERRWGFGFLFVARKAVGV